MKQSATQPQRHSPNGEKPLFSRENRVAAPSIYPVQQVDTHEREFRRASQSKSERWTLRTPTKRDITRRLEKVSAEDAHRLKQCCSSFRVLTCGTHTLRSYPTFRCKKLFCPDCAAERATRLGNQTEGKIREVMKTIKGRLCFLTLTMKNAATLDGGLVKLKKNFAKFKRGKDWKAHIKGYFGAFEYTFNPKTNDFHVHLHLIVLRGKFWNQSDISDAWREVTGDSFVVDIREIKNTHKGVKEVCKYPMKPADLMKMPDDKFLEVIKMKKGTRMFVSGGCFYNVKLDESDDAADDNVFAQYAELTEGDACPFCKQELFDVLVNREQHIGLHELNAMPTVVKTNSS
jgi:hypothetical protein